MALEFALDAAAVAGRDGGRAGVPRLVVPARAVGRHRLAGRRAWSAIVAFLASAPSGGWRASRLDDLSLAMTLDRFRPGTGQQVADVLQLPDLLGEPATSASPAMVRLAVQPASEALAASDWRSLWNRGRTAARVAALCSSALLVPIAFAALGAGGGPAERGALAARVVRALAAADLSHRDWAWTTATGCSRPATSRSRWRSGPTCRWSSREGTLLDRPRPGRAAVVRREPGPAGRRPEPVRVRERTAEGAVRDAVMVATGPARFRYELPPSSASSTFELTGGDDWLGPITVERVDRPVAGRRSSSASRSPAPPTSGFRRDRGPAPAPGLPARHRGRADARRQRADRRTPGSNVHPGKPPELERVDDRTFAAQLDPPRGDDAGDPADVERDRPDLEARLPLARAAEGPRAAGHAAGPGRRRPRHAGRHDPALRSPRPTTSGWRPSACRSTGRRSPATRKAEPKTTQDRRVPLPLAADAGRAGARPPGPARRRSCRPTRPPVGTVLRFVAEADDRCARGAQIGRSSVLQMQVVSPDELFYEILIRQRAERAKFVAVLEAAREADPGRWPARRRPRTTPPSCAGLHAGSRQLDQIAGRIADTLQEMKLNQVGSPKSHRLLAGRRHRPDPGPRRRPRERAPERAPVARRHRAQGSARDAGGGPTAARRGRCRMKTILDTDVAVGELRRRREPGRRSDQDAAEGPPGHREGPGVADAGGFR